MSSPNSVGVKLDVVEMLSVGEETAVARMSAKVSEGYSTSYEMAGDTMPRKVEEPVEILGSESNRSINLSRGDFSGRRVPFHFLLFALQPGSMNLTKFLVRKSGSNARRRGKSHTVHSDSLHPISLNPILPSISGF